ncbi:Chemotaxis protein methyltransferase 1 [Candidatus Defluviicoccus seviourii]|uniref:protein-glutamate O-methyltransferase n=2 Tax=root TaxID=1 RepID=A0A564WB10_9PROT|nr:Chemotaxis protein methyltransferase 1 [uncultured Defluviicoccus sp.]VUX45317.1 Chemotaxis protein methyltransferase 1 [Candidatus Defluviicoccus seviourii]
MQAADFQFLSALIKERSGIALSSDKTYLLENRLGPLAAQRRLNDIAGLVARMKSVRDEQLIRDVVEAMTTNESLFFRDGKPFELLRTAILPRIVAARPKERPLRIWSAACSSGQEAYSIAITLLEEEALLAGRPVEIVATDIATSMLIKAKAGVYSQFEVQRGLPIRLLLKYFTQKGTNWEIAPRLRSMVSFRQHNMLGECAGLGRFDIVFCRNVLIYFDEPTKKGVIERIAQVLAPDGVLLLGAVETIIGLSTRLEIVPGAAGIYRPVGSGPRAAVA